MFEATCESFVKTTGLQHPSPNLDDAANCKPLQACIRKRPPPCLFFKSAKHTPTSFRLSQLMLPQKDKDGADVPFDVPVDSRRLVIDSVKSVESLKGKFGTKLKLLDIDVEGSKLVTITADLGEVVKEEVRIPDLMKAVSERRIDMNHTFVRQLSSSKRKSICVVTGNAHIVKDTEIHASNVKDAKEKIEADIELSNKKVEIIDTDEEVEFKSTKKKTMVLPEGSILGYEVRELQIYDDGSMELLVDQDQRGGIGDPSQCCGGSSSSHTSARKQQRRPPSDSAAAQM